MVKGILYSTEKRVDRRNENEVKSLAGNNEKVIEEYVDSATETTAKKSKNSFWQAVIYSMK